MLFISLFSSETHAEQHSRSSETVKSCWSSYFKLKRTESHLTNEKTEAERTTLSCQSLQVSYLNDCS